MPEFGVAAMGDLIRRFVAERRGGIAVEYALAVGLLGATLALGLAALGDALDQSYEPVTVVTSQAYELANQRGF
jgi:Flp pilus assembly pilin Flp